MNGKLTFLRRSDSSTCTVGSSLAVLCVSAVLFVGLVGCGTSAKRELRVQALAEAHQLGPARLHDALSEADQAVLSNLRRRLAIEIYPLWEAERAVHRWFADCLERLGAVGQSAPAEVAACTAAQAELEGSLQTLRDAPLSVTGTADSLAKLETLLEAAITYLTTEHERKPRPTSHALYAVMVDAHNDWVEATEARRDEMIEALPALFEGLSTGATP